MIIESESMKLAIKPRESAFLFVRSKHSSVMSFSTVSKKILELDYVWVNMYRNF